jgi:hypothetical protein
MADWPGPDELKQILDVTSEDWDETLDRVLSAAIAHVKQDVGGWDDAVDEPDDSLAQAALVAAEVLSQRTEVARSQAISDPRYLMLIKGHRKRFAVA